MAEFKQKGDIRATMPYFVCWANQMEAKRGQIGFVSAVATLSRNNLLEAARL
jgi:hypothetical protein